MEDEEVIISFFEVVHDGSAVDLCSFIDLSSEVGVSRVEIGQVESVGDESDEGGAFDEVIVADLEAGDFGLGVEFFEPVALGFAFEKTYFNFLNLDSRDIEQSLNRLT